MNIYTPNQNDIIHETNVDFVLRPCSKEIHIVQYDKSLPIIKVELFKNGERYILPESDIIINVRLGKLDRTFVYKSILGTNETRDTVYFEVDEQMATVPGRISPVIEIIEGNKVACSSPIHMVIDRNPIQNGQIESQDYFPIIYELQSKISEIVEIEANPIIPESVTPTPLSRIKIGDRYYDISAEIGSTTDDVVFLSEDLYIYTPCGFITEASPTNPIKVGNAGDSIRDVFNKLFVGNDQNPIVYIPYLNASIQPNAGYTYPLVKGEILEETTFTVTYNPPTQASSYIDGYYEYGSRENISSKHAGIKVLSTSVVANGVRVLADISNQDISDTIVGGSLIVTTNSSVTISGELTFDLSDVLTARTMQGNVASGVASGSTAGATINSATGKLSTTSITFSKQFSLASSAELKDDSEYKKPTINIVKVGGFPQENSYVEIGTTINPIFKITNSNSGGVYPYGYYIGDIYTSGRQTNNCSIGDLTVTTTSGGSRIVQYDANIYSPTITINSQGEYRTDNISASGNFSVDTSRIPASKNGNKIDVSISDNRINGSSTSYNATKTLSAIKFYGYVPAFYGFKTRNNLIADPTVITSEQILNLGSSIRNSDAYNGIKPSAISASDIWRQFFIAIPDGNGWSSSKPVIKDINDYSLTVEETTATVVFQGISVSYKVYYINNAADYETLHLRITW